MTSPKRELEEELPLDARLSKRKQKRESSEKVTVAAICSLRSCGYPERKLTTDEARVDTSCGPIKGKQDQSKWLIDWSPATGNAALHGACWKIVKELAEKPSRGRGPVAGGLTRDESRRVLTASKTAEYHDSLKTTMEHAEKFVGLVKKAKHFVAFTGAGVSTAAGIGDYRGISGKWTLEELATEQHDAEEGVPYERLRPTYTHEALVKLQDLGILKYLISQNCDGLHLLSGIKKELLSEMHGNVFLEFCTKCGKEYFRDYYVMDDADESDNCARCHFNHLTGRKCSVKRCKGDLSDSIINFGDLLNHEVLSRAEKNAKECDVFLALGTSMIVTPAASLVEHSKAYAICNRQTTSYDDGAAVRVFGDCDPFMKLVMVKLLGEEEERKWCSGLASKLSGYDAQRAAV